MKRIIFNAIVLSIIVPASIYLMFAYFLGDFDVSYWHSGWRIALAAAISFFVVFFVSGIFTSRKIIKKIEEYERKRPKSKFEKKLEEMEKMRSQARKAAENDEKECRND